MDRYYKNVILCGNVDYYCLLCNEAFELPDEIERHIRWEQHRKNMKNLSYNAKYRDDHIYKIGKYFYCEVCNYATKTSVENHIKEYEHLFRKSNPSEPNIVPRADDNVAQKGKRKTMGKFQRHGIINNHCTLCNVPVQNMAHLEEVDHMVAIIQSCQLTNIRGRNKIKGDQEVNKECDRKNKQGHKKPLVNKILTISDEEKETISDLLKKEKKYFYINLKEGKARCVQCKFQISDVTVSELSAHRRAHITENEESDSSDDSIKYTELVDHGNKRSVLKIYGNRHYIRLNEGGRKGYCNLCEINISADLNMFKLHVRGTRHQGMLYARRIKNGLHNDFTFYPPMVKPFHTYLQHIKLSDELNLVCLNNCIYVDRFSFYFLLPNESKMKCLVCNEVKDYQDMAMHVSTNEHMKKFVSASMASIDDDPRFADEFVRKIQPDLYHCGYCNKVLPYWDTTRIHLKSRGHRVAKKVKQLYITTPEEAFKKSKFVKSKNNNALMKKLKNLFP